MLRNVNSVSRSYRKLKVLFRHSKVAFISLSTFLAGLCNLNGSVYCIGGTYGQSGNKHCFILSEDHSKWERIASLNTGTNAQKVWSKVA